MLWTISVLLIATYAYSKYFHSRCTLNTNSLKDTSNILFGFISVGLLMYIHQMFPLNQIYFGEVHHFILPMGEEMVKVKPTLLSFLFYDFFQVGLPEEIAKYFALGISLYLMPALSRKESMYRGACVGLGFAFLENYQYVEMLNAPMYLRLALPTMFHASLGLLMGYFLYNLKKEDFYKGLAICTFLHGSYDFVLMVGLDVNLAMSLAIFFLVMTILCGEQLLKKANNDYICDNKHKESCYQIGTN